MKYCCCGWCTVGGAADEIDAAAAADEIDAAAAAAGAAAVVVLEMKYVLLS